MLYSPVREGISLAVQDATNRRRMAHKCSSISQQIVANRFDKIVSDLLLSLISLGRSCPFIQAMPRVGSEDIISHVTLSTAIIGSNIWQPCSAWPCNGVRAVFIVHVQEDTPTLSSSMGVRGQAEWWARGDVAMATISPVLLGPGRQLRGVVLPH